MESERWGSFPRLAPSGCQNSNALPTPHDDFCGRCACFPGEFILAMQMCFTEAIACCCIMQPGIKQYMLFVAFLKCKPEVTAELRDAAKNVNTMILAGKNTASPPSSHSLLLSCNFAKSFLYLSVKPKVTHLCDFHFDLRWLWVPSPQDLTRPHQWQTQGSSGKSRGG